MFCKKNKLGEFSEMLLEWFKQLPKKQISLRTLYENNKFRNELTIIQGEWLYESIGTQLNKYILKIYLDQLVSLGKLELIYCEIDSDDLSVYKLKD